MISLAFGILALVALGMPSCLPMQTTDQLEMLTACGVTFLLLCATFAVRELFSEFKQRKY